MALQENIIIRVNEDSTKAVLSFDEWLDRGTSWWRTRASRVIECDRAVVVTFDNIVVATGRVRGVSKDLDGGSGRIAIDVVPEPQSELLGRRIAVNGSRNPISFVRQIEILA